MWHCWRLINAFKQKVEYFVKCLNMEDSLIQFRSDSHGIVPKCSASFVLRRLRITLTTLPVKRTHRLYEDHVDYMSFAPCLISGTETNSNRQVNCLILLNELYNLYSVGHGWSRVGKRFRQCDKDSDDTSVNVAGCYRDSSSFKS